MNFCWLERHFISVANGWVGHGQDYYSKRRDEISKTNGHKPLAVDTGTGNSAPEALSFSRLDGRLLK